MTIDLTRFNYYSPLGQTVDTKTLQKYASPYFVRNTDGSLTFMAPSFGDGITHTQNSTYPRSELRETLVNGDDKEANWSVKSSPVHIIHQDFSVDELPKSGKAIIGQIHGESNHPPYKNQISPAKAAGKFDIYAQLRRSLNGSEDKVVIVPNYALGARIQLQTWFYADGTMRIFRNLGFGWEQVVSSVLLPEGYQYDMASYANDTWYFKVGMYSQQIIDEKDSSLGRGVVTYWDFGITHGAVPQYRPDQTPPAPEPDPEPTPDPVDPYVAVQKRLDELEARYKAALKSIQSSLKSELNVLTTDMKALSDKDKLAPIYTEITAFKADMTNGLTVTTK